MIDSLPPAVRIAIRARTGIAGFVFGLSLLMAVVVLNRMPLGQECFLTQIGLTVGLAGLASLVATLLIPWKRIPRVRSLGVGGRIGLKTGLIIGLLGGASLCVAAFVRAQQCEYADEESAAKARLWATWVVALSGVLPSVCVGFVGGSVGAMLGCPPASECPHQTLPIEEPALHPPWIRWLERGTSGAAAFGLILPVVSLISGEKPVRASEGTKVTAASWKYQHPGDTTTAAPKQFVMVARLPFPDCIPGTPFTISPDGNWLAYAPAGRSAVATFDLNTSRLHRQYQLEGTASSLSWSPDSEQLMILSRDSPGKGGLVIAGVESAATIALPLPKERDLPRGPVLWAAPTEVLFFPDDEPALLYDLVDLRLYRLTTRDKYRSSTDWTAEKKFALPETPYWRLEPAEYLTEYVPPPRRSPNGTSEFHFYNCLAFAHPSQPVRCPIPEFPLRTGVTIAPSKDGTKIVRAENSKVEVFYFGLREPKPSQFTLAMPAPNEATGSDKTVVNALKEFSLCAMIYEPLINPLTKKTIGPDRQRPKGILRFLTWIERKATLWAAESYAPLAQGMVVADVHEWDNGQLALSPLLPDPFWWTLLGEGESGTTLPPRAKPLPLHWTPSYSHRGDLFLTLGESLMAVPAPESDPVEPVPAPAIPEALSIEQRIQQFVAEHHEKARAGDIAGLGRDYDENVDYLGQTKSNEAILQEESRYHQQWSRVMEQVTSPVIVTRLDGSSFSVEYTITYRTERGSEWASGRNDLTLWVRELHDRILITRQSARLYDRQSSPKAAANHPTNSAQPARLKPVAITLPKPCWVAAVRDPNDKSMEITDVFHLDGNKYKLHRTYRRLSADGLKVVASCRAEYDGTLQQSGNVLPVYFGHQSWGQEGSDALVKEVEANAASVIGSTLELTIQPDGSLGRGAGSMKRVQ